MINYVLCVAKTGNKYVFIKKERPAWQKGKLNFVGGKIEAEETAKAATVREFFEETGIRTEDSDWTYKGILYKPDVFKIWVFYSNKDEYINAKTVTDEEIIVKDDYDNCHHSLEWIAKLIEDEDQKTFTIEYH